MIYKKTITITDIFKEHNIVVGLKNYHTTATTNFVIMVDTNGMLFLSWFSNYLSLILNANANGLSQVAG